MLIIATNVVHIWRVRYDSASLFREKHPMNKTVVAAKRTKILTTVWPFPRNIGIGVSPKRETVNNSMEKIIKPGRTRNAERSILKSVHVICDEGSSALHWNLA
jgi:hypothetical protein